MIPMFPPIGMIVVLSGILAAFFAVRASVILPKITAGMSRTSVVLVAIMSFAFGLVSGIYAVLRGMSQPSGALLPVAGVVSLVFGCTFGAMLLVGLIERRP